PSVGRSFQPTMRPRTRPDILQRGILHGGTDDRIVASISRRSVFVVHPLTDARIHRNQVEAINVEAILILAKEVVTENAVPYQRINVIVIRGLVCGSVAVAHDDEDFLPRIWAIIYQLCTGRRSTLGG